MALDDISLSLGDCDLAAGRKRQRLDSPYRVNEQFINAITASFILERSLLPQKVLKRSRN